MPRPRRTISDTGHLTCTHCKELKHISEFYQAADSVWFIQEDPKTGECTIYGKPNSWCKDCMRANARSINKSNRQEKLETQVKEDLEWEKAQEIMAAQGYELIKDQDGTIRRIKIEEDESPSGVSIWDTFDPSELVTRPTEED